MKLINIEGLVKKHLNAFTRLKEEEILKKK